jgi:hypothetical protein
MSLWCKVLCVAPRGRSGRVGSIWAVRSWVESEHSEDSVVYGGAHNRHWIRVIAAFLFPFLLAGFGILFDFFIGGRSKYFGKCFDRYILGGGV